MYYVLVVFLPTSYYIVDPDPKTHTHDNYNINNFINIIRIIIILSRNRTSEMLVITHCLSHTSQHLLVSLLIEHQYTSSLYQPIVVINRSRPHHLPIRLLAFSPLFWLGLLLAIDRTYPLLPSFSKGENLRVGSVMSGIDPVRGWEEGGEKAR